MDAENRQHYFVIGSVFLEIVTPIFQNRLQRDYQHRGFVSLQSFLDSQQVKHNLFHLRFKSSCCKDQANCVNRRSLPLTNYQWDLLYSENPASCNQCHCKYAAKSLQISDLDISFAGLILLNCCNLTQGEDHAIRTLRQHKNAKFSHNTTGQITKTDYDILRADMEKDVLQLDNTKQDAFKMIENRPMDEPLCKRHFTCLLDTHQQLEEIHTSFEGVRKIITEVDNKVQSVNTTIKQMETFQDVGTSVKSIDETMNKMVHEIRKSNEESTQRINSSFEKLLSIVKKGIPDKDKNQYGTGDHIFYLLKCENTAAVVGNNTDICGFQMMDDGRLVFCSSNLNKLLICNAENFQSEIINLQKQPKGITVITRNQIAILFESHIKIYDINFEENNIKSIHIPVPQPGWCHYITSTIDDRLIVGASYKIRYDSDERKTLLFIIDHQSEKIIQMIDMDKYPNFIHVSNGKIFNYGCILYTYNLNCFSFSGDKIFTKKLPSQPRKMVALADGSWYVVCTDGSIQHVSKDGKHSNKVKTSELQSTKDSKKTGNM
ncbi:Hypothetical predicted protein [Mytilus galloprovincialis]|uniref:DZIP3-like HEPN domain-containing protein n=1 Tax=Mytilus galloprovincialis TaxID=29158 RepID=A0A8B6FA88_MYTGA|nr:Hypothetical predicted protein [Mytilus galloprovincialis]